MDGLFHGKPYEQMDDLGYPYCWKHPQLAPEKIVVGRGSLSYWVKR